MRLKKRNHSLPGTGKDERQGHKKTGMIDFKSLISVFILCCNICTNCPDCHFHFIVKIRNCKGWNPYLDSLLSLQFTAFKQPAKNLPLLIADYPEQLFWLHLIYFT